MVKSKEVVIILGCKDKTLTKRRIEFAESKFKDFYRFKFIFSGTKQEVGWMKKYSHMKAILEVKSVTTPENLINSKKFIENAEKVWIVTDKSHAFRARYLARKILGSVKFEVLGAKMPLIFKIKQLWYEMSRLVRHVFE
jgi:hypothetical protein